MKKLENLFVSDGKDKQARPSMIQRLKLADKYLKTLPVTVSKLSDTEHGSQRCPYTNSFRIT